MLNGDAHHSLEAEVELRIWPLPDFQTRARHDSRCRARSSPFPLAVEVVFLMSLTPNEIIAPLSHVHGGRGAAGRVWLVPQTGGADKPAPAAKGSRGGRKD